MADTVRRADPFGLSESILDGRFKVLQPVAEGGFGVVYRAAQLALERTVALKVLKTPSHMTAEQCEQFHARFAAEARTIARIRHRNIVDVYDFGVSRMPLGGSAPWMALEWLNGETLDVSLAARRGRGGRSPAEALALTRPILRAMAYAHREGIAHRDIKPGNLMLCAPEPCSSTDEGGLMLRILDFGIAKVMNQDESPGSGRTLTASVPAFSPNYAAPEQLAYGRTGPWTDVHALGLLLTELLIDEPPYRETDLQLYEAIMSSERPTPGSRGRDVGDWESVLARALSFSPSERWKDAGDLLAALEATVDNASPRASTFRTRLQHSVSGTALMSPGTPGAQADRADAPVRAPPRRGRALGLTLAALVLGAAATAGWLWSTVGSRSARSTATASAPAPVADWPLPAAPRPAPPLPETVSPRPAIPPVPATNTGDHTGAVNTASVAKPEPAPPAVATGRRKAARSGSAALAAPPKNHSGLPSPSSAAPPAEPAEPHSSRLQDLLDNRK